MRIELVNKKTKEVTIFDNVRDMNNGEKLYYKFNINLTQIEDGEYTLSLFDEDENLVVTDTLCVGLFDATGLQYKKGENIYITTELDTKLEERTITLEEENKVTILPSEGFDGMSVVIVNAQPLYNAAYNQGSADTYENAYNIGYSQGNTDGYTTATEDAKARMSSINITSNGTYTNENGYNEVNVNVQGQIDFTVIGYDEQSNQDINDALNAPIQYSVQKLEEWNNKPEWEKENTSYLYQSDSSLVYAPKIDTAQVTNMEGMYNYCSNLKYVPILNTVNVWNMEGMFTGCGSLTNVSKFNTRNVTNMHTMFSYCTNLQSVPEFNTQNVTNMSSMFEYCQNLTKVSHFDTHNVTDFHMMFYYCSNLTEVPAFDISSAIDMHDMFRGTGVRYIVFSGNSSNCENMNATFADCYSLEKGPELDTSNCSNLDGMFYQCTSLTSIPYYNTSKCTNMTRMLSYTQIKTIPQLDMSKVTTVESMFEGCSSLESLPKLNWSSVENVSGVFGWDTNWNLTELGGFEGFKWDWDNYEGLYLCPYLTYESIMNVINNLYDFRAAGINSIIRTLRINPESMSKLSNNDIAVATAKGWALVSD